LLRVDDGTPWGEEAKKNQSQASIESESGPLFTSGWPYPFRLKGEMGNFFARGDGGVSLEDFNSGCLS